MSEALTPYEFSALIWVDSVLRARELEIGGTGFIQRLDARLLISEEKLDQERERRWEATVKKRSKRLEYLRRYAQRRRSALPYGSAETATQKLKMRRREQ